MKAPGSANPGSKKRRWRCGPWRDLPPFLVRNKPHYKRILQSTANAGPEDKQRARPQQRSARRSPSWWWRVTLCTATGARRPVRCFTSFTTVPRPTHRPLATGGRAVRRPRPGRAGSSAPLHLSGKSRRRYSYEARIGPCSHKHRKYRYKELPKPTTHLVSPRKDACSARIAAAQPRYGLSLAAPKLQILNDRQNVKPVLRLSEG